MTSSGMLNGKVASADEGFGTEKVLVKEEYSEKPAVSYTLTSTVNKTRKRKHTLDDLQKAKQTFYENEDKRAHERHELQMKELQLKLNLLSSELELKKLKAEKRV